MLIEATRLLLFPAVMAFAASSDLLTMTIPNRVSLLLAAGFVGLALATGMDVQDIGWHLLAGVLVLAISFVFFAQGWIGGGDAKLAAATALWLGFDHLLAYAVYASLLGGVLTLALLQLRQLPLPELVARQPWVGRLHDKQGDIPYGIALAAAALLIYPETLWLHPVAV